MLERFLSEDRRRSMDWDSLSAGAPTVLALARLAAESWVLPARETEGLSVEARAILFLARDRGVIELRATNDAFDSADRLLVVQIETSAEQRVALRTPGDPRGTMKFLEGLRQLCECGLVIHHLQREFSLTGRGFALAESLNQAGLESALQAAQSIH